MLPPENAVVPSQGSSSAPAPIALEKSPAASSSPVHPKSSSKATPIPALVVLLIKQRRHIQMLPWTSLRSLRNPHLFSLQPMPWLLLPIRRKCSPFQPNCRILRLITFPSFSAIMTVYNPSIPSSSSTSSTRGPFLSHPSPRLPVTDQALSPRTADGPAPTCPSTSS